jgi:hypothetical protein
MDAAIPPPRKDKKVYRAMVVRTAFVLVVAYLAMRTMAPSAACDGEVAAGKAPPPADAAKGAAVARAPAELGDAYRLVVDTPDQDVNHGTELAVGAFWRFDLTFPKRDLRLHSETWAIRGTASGRRNPGLWICLNRAML